MWCACKNSNARRQHFRTPRFDPWATKPWCTDRAHGMAWRFWRAACRSKFAAACPEIPPTSKHAMSRPQSTAWLSAAATCPMAIHSPVPSSATSWTGSLVSMRMLRRCSRRTIRWCWRATTTWCRPTPTFTQPGRSWTTHCCNPSRGRRTRRCWRPDGPTRYTVNRPTRRSIPSGVICATAGREMPACASTICS